MITNEQAEQAAEFLLRKAGELGRAKAEAIKCERMLKVTLATEKKRHHDQPANVQEREALISSKYQAAIDAEFTANLAHETAKAVWAAVEMEIEVWRTQQATARAQDRAISGRQGQSYGA